MNNLENLDILWDGNLSLKRIRWGKVSLEHINLTANSWMEIQNNWKAHLKRNPNDYNGNLLFIDEIERKKGKMILNVSTISFSAVIYFEKIKKKNSSRCGDAGCSICSSFTL